MTLNGKNILVTGAAGLIGSNLTKRLASDYDCRVHATYNKTPLSYGASNINSISANLCNDEDCNNITQNIDVVFHCAADSSGAATHEKNPLSMFKNNTIMNVNLLNAAYNNKVKKFVWFASTTGYPEGNEQMVESDMFKGDPFDKYFAVGWMKRYTEKLCEMYATKVKDPMTCIVLRPTNIYGPGDKIDPKRSHVLAALIRKVVEKQNPIEIWGDGTEIRDVLYVSDMVDATIEAVEQVDGFDQFNIGYGTSYSVLGLLDLIKEIAKYDAPYKFIEGPRMIPTRRVSIEKAYKVLGWSPNVTLYDGILSTYRWMSKVLSTEVGVTGMYD
jgi:GDP-L-fucose synthase